MGYFFGFTGRCAYNSGGGGLISRSLRYVHHYISITVCHISPDKGLCDFVGADL